MSDYTIDELYNIPVDPAQVKEANAFRVVPAGSYQAIATKVDIQENPETFRNPGRKGVRVQASLADNDGNRKGVVFFNASWEAIRDDKGRLDKDSKLWGQLVKALDMGEKSVGEVIDAAQRYPFKVFVTVAYKRPEGGYVYPKTDADAEQAEREGYTPTNFVQSVGRAA